MYYSKERILDITPCKKKAEESAQIFEQYDGEFDSMFDVLYDEWLKECKETLKNLGMNVEAWLIRDDGYLIRGNDSKIMLGGYIKSWDEYLEGIFGVKGLK